MSTHNNVLSRNMKNIKTPLLYSKTGVYRGIPYFSYFAKKHRLWVLIRIEAVLMSPHNLWFEQKHEKYQKFLSEIFIFFLVVKFSIHCIFE